MAQNKDHLFPAYRVLEEAERTWNISRPPYNKLKNRRVLQRPHLDREAPAKLERYLESGFLDPLERDVLMELQAARKVRKKADDQRKAELQFEREEELNAIRAQAEGTMSECGCCFGDFPLNRMVCRVSVKTFPSSDNFRAAVHMQALVRKLRCNFYYDTSNHVHAPKTRRTDANSIMKVHCNNEQVMHWFCKGCAKQTAENEIGNSKYELRCMSMDDCEAGFANDQRSVRLYRFQTHADAYQNFVS